MKIKFYNADDLDGKKIKEFLINNNLQFNEIKINSSPQISKLKIMYNHSIHIIEGFNELALKQQLLEHISKYKPKIEVD